jgi:hypothetical protein
MDTMTADALGRFVRRDSIAAVTTDAGSAVLAFEIDEDTENRRTIGGLARGLWTPARDPSIAASRCHGRESRRGLMGDALAVKERAPWRVTLDTAIPGGEAVYDWSLVPTRIVRWG